jgi:hypothetical protein
MRAAIILASALLCVTGCQDSRISKARDAVKEKMIDPDSAKFEQVELCPASDMVHGEVNGKNRLGAYAGSNIFFVSDGIAYMPDGAPEQNLPSARFIDALSQECFFGNGAKNLGDFTKSYDAAHDSVEKYYKDAAARAK